MKKIVYMLVCLACLSACTLNRREEIRLKEWQFCMEQDSMQMPEEGWQQVTLPHDWAITGEFSRDNDLQNVAITQNGEVVPSLKTGRTGGLPYTGAGWYKTNISRKKGDNSHFTLYVDGAMSEARVYVNGVEAEFWPYGYNAFFVEITDLLKNGCNELSIRLENRPESSRWYPGAGLFRYVSLIKTKPTHVAVWGQHIATNVIKDNKATVSVKTTVDAKQGTLLQVRTVIKHGSRRVQEKKSTYRVGTKPLEQIFEIENPSLWSPETPDLYIARCYIYEDGTCVDKVEQTFGIRTVSIEPNVGFRLNGEVRKFKGVCLHHDLGPLGAAAYRYGIKHQLEMLKDMGCDAIRTTHNMPASDFVDLADSMGFMLLVEPFDEWEWGKCKNGYNRFFEKVEEGETLTWAERDMVNMLRHFRSHPSVVMWSIGNEVPTQCSPQGYKVAKFLQDICTREDGTRPVTCGMDGVDCVLENGFAEVMQVIGINYRAHRYEEIYDATPQKLVLGSETASTVSSRGVYKLPAVKDSNDKVCNVPKPNGNSETNQCTGYDLEYCPWSNIPDDDFANMDDFPWTIGQFVWTGFDYLGEPSPWDTDAWPSHSSYFGIIDLASIPKDRYYLYRSQWNKKEHTLHLLPHWNFSEGDTLPVMVYTDYAEVELFLNDSSLGRQHFLTKEEAEQDLRWGKCRRYRLIWDDIAWQAGELKAVAYDAEGKAVETTVVRTAGEPKQLKIENHKTGSLSYLEVSVVDKDGNLCPKANLPINIKVEGSGKMLGAANGDACCLIPFQSLNQQTFNGKMTIVVEGSCNVTVSSDGLSTTSYRVWNW